MNLALKLKIIPHLAMLADIAKKRKIKIWLVGGFLRDICLKVDKPLLDFDFCLEKNTTALAREFARRLSAKCIVLDSKQESLRVAIKQAGRLYTYDFTRLRGDDLDQDLALRDFSVNALALDLNKRPFELIDRYQARKDLKHGKVRVIRVGVIAADPLRILRGFTLMAKYSFIIEPKTLTIMAKNKKRLKKVSAERLSEELFKIFSSPRCYKALKLMDKMKIIDEVLPPIAKARGVYQGRYHHLDVWKHSLEALRQLEFLYQRSFVKNRNLFNYLNQELAQGRSRLQIVKLACLLHDIGKPLAKKRLKKRTIFHAHEKIGRDMAAKLGRKLRLSLREIDSLKKLIFWHLRPGYLADQSKPTHRAVYRFFRDTKEEGVAVIILSLADWRATRGPLINSAKRRRHEKIMLSLINDYFRELNKKPLTKLVDGYDIMKKFKLKPSALIGEILQSLNEEQALGRISSKAAAFAFAKTIIHTRCGGKVRGTKRCRQEKTR